MSIETMDKRFGMVKDTDFSEEARPFARFKVDAGSGSEALRLAKLDWPVAKVPLYTGDGLRVPGRVATVRMDLPETDRGRVLGVVGENYEIVQNSEAFAFVDELLAAGARIEAAGCTGTGQRVWMRLGLPGAFAINGDDYKRRIIIWTGHDGYTSIRMAAELYRLICLNGMVALADSARISISHTTNARELVSEAQDSLRWAEHVFAHSREQLGTLLTKSIPGGPRQWLTQLVPVTRTKNRVSGELQVSQRGENIRLRILDRLSNSPAIEGHRSSLYGMVQAVSEYTDHDRVKVAKTGAALKTMWWGSSHGLKSRSLQLALAS